MGGERVRWLCGEYRGGEEEERETGEHDAPQRSVAGGHWLRCGGKSKSEGFDAKGAKGAKFREVEMGQGLVGVGWRAVGLRMPMRPWGPTA